MLSYSNVIRIAFRQYQSTSHNVYRLPVLTLFTKDPCPLCDIAKEQIAHLSNQFCLVTVDITEPANKHWWDKYKYDIPVFHFEGEFLMQHRADVHLLSNALKEFQNLNIS